MFFFVVMYAEDQNLVVCASWCWFVSDIFDFGIVGALLETIKAFGLTVEFRRSAVN